MRSRAWAGLVPGRTGSLQVPACLGRATLVKSLSASGLVSLPLGTHWSDIREVMHVEGPGTHRATITPAPTEANSLDAPTMAAFTPVPGLPLGPGRPGYSYFTDEETEAHKKVSPKSHQSSGQSLDFKALGAPLRPLIPELFPARQGHSPASIKRSLWLLSGE